MPIAVAIGWEPSIGFCAGSPVPKGICEYDVMGAIRGEPVELVKCETIDLYVPAIGRDRDRGHARARCRHLRDGRPVCRVHRLFGRRPVAQADDPRHRITHRNDPILRGTIEGCMPGSYSENAMISLDLPLLDRLERARPCRRARHHRRVGSAGAGRHQPLRPDQAELSRAGQAGRQRAVGHRPPRMCATSTSPWSTTTSTSTIMPPSTGRSPTGSMPAKTTS